MALIEPAAGVDAPAPEESTVDRFVIRPLTEIWDRIVEHAPSIATAIVVLIALWLVAKIARASIQRVLQVSKVDNLLADTRLERMLGSFQEGFTLSKAIGYLVYIAVILVAWMTAADIVGLSMVRDVVMGILGYLPQLGAGMCVFVIGGFLASTARRAVASALNEVETPYARALESLVEFLLLLVASTIALDTLGADMTIISSNLTLILGAVLLTMLVLFVWSMRRPAEEIIANYYLRRLVSIGDTVVVNAEQGVVLGFAPLGIMIKGSDGVERFVPARHILNGVERVDRARPTDVGGAAGS